MSLDYPRTLDLDLWRVYCDTLADAGDPRAKPLAAALAGDAPTLPELWCCALLIVDWVSADCEAIGEIYDHGTYGGWVDMWHTWQDLLDIYGERSHPHLEVARAEVLARYDCGQDVSGYWHQNAGVPYFADGSTLFSTMRAWGDIVAAALNQRAIDEGQVAPGGPPASLPKSERLYWRPPDVDNVYRRGFRSYAHFAWSDPRAGLE